MRRTGIAPLTLLLGLLLAAPLHASSQDIDVRLFEPAPDDSGGLHLLGTRVPKAFDSIFGLSLDFARNPLILVAGRDEAREVVGATVSADLMASIGVLDLFQVSLTLPIAIYTGGDGIMPGEDISASGLGDIRLLVKWQALDRRENPVGFAFVNSLAFPTAQPRNSFLGGDNNGVLYEPRLVLDAKVGPAILLANLGYRTRPASQLLGLRVGDEWFYGGGLVIKALDELDVLGELFGATTAHAPFGAKEVHHTLEGLLGLRYRPGSDVTVRSGLGFGLLPGYGCPEFRFLLGLTWAPSFEEPAPPPPPPAVEEPEPAPKDSDGDGKLDPDDACPDQAEDADGFKDEDGCPDPDNDQDGVLDATDQCSDQAEDQDGFEDTDGCPDLDTDKDGIPDATDKCPDKPESKNGVDDEDGCPEGDQDKDGVLDAVDSCPADAEDPDGYEDHDGCPDKDNDQDGVPDQSDRCPMEAEDRDGFEDADGCPDRDDDKDGVPDTDDRCPKEAEDKDGFEDADGCPDPDNDKDGIADAKDKCPNEPETINGVKDTDGCPDQGAMKVVVTRERIEIKEKIFFDRNRAKIQKRSFSILDQVAQVLNANSQIAKIRIEGHTDSSGRERVNLRLSQKRAEAVRSYLIRRGVDPVRLEAAGFGSTKPIANNSTSEGRAANRRVEFHIAGQ